MDSNLELLKNRRIGGSSKTKKCSVQSREFHNQIRWWVRAPFVDQGKQIEKNWGDERKAT